MKRILLAIFMIMMLMPLASSVAGPQLVDPWTSGNAEFECNQTDCDSDFAYKIDNWDENNGMDGTYSHAGNTITVSNSDGETFDWDSEYPVCAVIVKASTKAYVYYYNGAYSGSALVAPEGKDISHATFCFNSGENGNEIPEFPTIAIPIAAIIGLAFIMQRRKE